MVAFLLPVGWDPLFLFVVSAVGSSASRSGALASSLWVDASVEGAKRLEQPASVELKYSVLRTPTVNWISQFQAYVVPSGHQDDFNLRLCVFLLAEQLWYGRTCWRLPPK